MKATNQVSESSHYYDQNLSLGDAQCANLIILEDGEYELYFNPDCACTLDSYLSWGPDEAVRFFREHEKHGDGWWLDTSTCDGGALIDLDQKVLLWFGGDSGASIPYRRAFWP